MLNSLYMRVAGLLMLMLLICAAYLYISNLKTDLAAAQQKLSETNVLLDTRTAELELIKKDAQVRLNTAQAALDTARSETIKAQQRARAIYKKAPSTPGDACKSALDLINHIGEEK